MRVCWTTSAYFDPAAGGTVAGSIRSDADVKPAVFATQLDVRVIQFKQALFPTVDL
jgi:hypothetical protein